MIPNNVGKHPPKMDGRKGSTIGKLKYSLCRLNILNLRYEINPTTITRGGKTISGMVPFNEKSVENKNHKNKPNPRLATINT
jgi:hypothetical protein